MPRVLAKRRQLKIKFSFFVNKMINNKQFFILLFIFKIQIARIERIGVFKYFKIKIEISK